MTKKITDLMLSAFNGDGKTKTFCLTYELVNRPFIRINNDYQNVGIAGIDQNCYWYWTQGSRTVTQDDTLPAPKESDRIDIIYQGQYELIEQH